MKSTKTGEPLSDLITRELANGFRNDFEENDEYDNDVFVEVDDRHHEIWIHGANDDIASEAKITADRVSNSLNLEAGIEILYGFKYTEYGENQDGKVVHFSNIRAVQ